MDSLSVAGGVPLQSTVTQALAVASNQRLYDMLLWEERHLPGVGTHVLSGLLQALMALGAQALQGRRLQPRALLLPLRSIAPHRAPAACIHLSGLTAKGNVICIATYCT